MARFAIAVAGLGMLAACSGLLGLTDPALDDGVANDGGGNDAATGEAATDEGGPCVADVTSDPKNCGRCGHDCLGGSCSASACQPVLVLDDPSSVAPFYMTEDVDNIYFTNARPDGVANVSKVSKHALNPTDGGVSAHPLLANFLLPDAGNPFVSFPYQISILGTKLFVAVSSTAYNTSNEYLGGVITCTTDSCGDVSQPGTFAVSAVNSEGVSADVSSVVYDAQKRQAADQLFLAGPSFQAASLIDIGGGVVSYALIDQGTLYVAKSTGVDSVASGSQMVNHLATVEAERLAVYGGYVYFTSSVTGSPSVQAVPVSSGGNPGPTVTIASGTGFFEAPNGIAADSRYVYFTDEGHFSSPTSGQVIRCPNIGCGVNGKDATILATGGNPRDILDDADAIYWGNRTGQIWKLAK